jgi:Cys-tRNA(Pro)/Cys-tRNA(Cys) deacylase
MRDFEMKKEDKTNVMRVLDGKKISYESHAYEQDQSLTGEDIARILGEDPEKVFKTLVTQGKSGAYYVFVVPVKEELDLKKAAKASGEKAISMIKQKELLPLTGYIHGGCSPIGMKKQFPTFIHETAIGYDKIFVSAGKVGFQIELEQRELLRMVYSKIAGIII